MTLSDTYLELNKREWMKDTYSSLTVLPYTTGFLDANSFHLERERIFSRSVIESEIPGSENVRSPWIWAVISGAPWCPNMASTTITDKLSRVWLNRKWRKKSWLLTALPQLVSQRESSALSESVLQFHCQCSLTHLTSTEYLFITTHSYPPKSQFLGDLSIYLSMQLCS